MHPLFGVMALPLSSRLYVRKVDIEAVKSRYDEGAGAKHELALELCRRVTGVLQGLGSLARFVVVSDGACAAGSLMRPLLAQGTIVVTRLRSDAKLFDVPPRKSCSVNGLANLE